MQVIEQYSKYNYYDYNNPKYIVIHYVRAQNTTAKSNADYFCSGNRNGSAHEFIDDNYCYKIIREDNGAWHIGNTRTEVNNRNSIGIKMCCMAPRLGVTVKTEINTIERVVYYMKKYNISINNLRTHYLVSGKREVCPNWAARDWNRFNEFKRKVETALQEKDSTLKVNNFNLENMSTDIVYRVKMANGEQIAASRSLDSAKDIAKINKCIVYRSDNRTIVESYLPSGNIASKTINYRVKSEEGQQLGAFSSYDNAECLAKKQLAIIYNKHGDKVESFVNKKNIGYINLNPNMKRCSVYAIDGPYTINKAVGYLLPSKFRGLSYEILEVKEANIYKIKTKTFGVVAMNLKIDMENVTITAKAKY